MKTHPATDGEFFSYQTHDREALAIAIGSLRLEGIEPDAEDVADMERVISGEITLGEYIERIKARLKNSL